MMVSRWLLALTVLALPSIVHADWINLNTGGRVVGDILRETRRDITIRSDAGGILTFRRRQVKDFYRSDPKAADPALMESGAKPARVSGPEYREGVASRSKDQHLGALVLRIPGSFVAVDRSVTATTSRNEETLGTFHEPRTSTLISVTRTPEIPEVRFDTFMRPLRERYAADPAYRVALWKRRTVAGHPAAVAELVTPQLQHSSTTLLEWVHFNDSIYRVKLSIPTATYRSGTSRYLEILQGIHFDSPDAVGGADAVEGAAEDAASSAVNSEGKESEKLTPVTPDPTAPRSGQANTSQAAPTSGPRDD